MADRTLFGDLSVTIHSGDRLGVVGINGTGKSTLLRVLAGRLDPDSGAVRQGRGVRTAFLDQAPSLPPGTVREAVGSGWEAAAALDRLGMGAHVDRDVSELSGGQAKRVALARVLAAPSELLVLDEPTNHLDLAAVAWLEDWLAAYPGGLVIVSHDRYLLDRVTTRMLELEVAMNRLGDKVIECRGVGVTYGSGPPVLADVDLIVGPGDRIGVVGANGTGKSTLLDVLAGELAATTGSVEVGPTVVVGYYDQHGTELDPGARVQEVVAGPLRTPGSLSDIALMKRFWFTGTLPFTRVGSLSGGERRRLQLLAVLARQPNVLLLDEPTNDLDLDTLRILEDFLDDWPGTLIVVSHDRAFLDRTIETVLAVGPGGVAPVPGGLDAWMAGLSAPTERPPAPAPKEEPPTARSDAPPVGRLLRDTEKQMAKLSRQRDKVHDALVATTDHVELTRLGAELRAVQDELDVVGG